MSAKRPTGILVLLVGAVAIALLWIRTRSEPASGPAPHAAGTRALQRVEIQPSDPPAVEEKEAPESVGARAVVATSEARKERERADERALVTVSARFVDPAGRPLPGVELSAASLEDAPVAVSGADGVAELVLDWADLRGFFPQAATFVFRGEGRVTHGENRHFSRPEDVFLGEIPLEPGGAARGRVVDELGGPVRAATVRSVRAVPLDAPGRELHSIRGGQPVSVTGRTEADGSFLLEGLPEMALSFDARARGTFFAVSGPVLIRAGEMAEVPELVLQSAPTGSRIGGIVTTEQGEPVKGAGIRLLDEERGYILGRVLTEPDGTFEFTVAPGERYALQVLDYSSHGWPDVELDAIEPGTTDIVVVFRDTRPLRVRVTGADGRPVRRFQATVTTTDHRVVPGGRAVSDDGRLVELRAPQAPYQVGVQAPGYAPERRGPLDPAEPVEELVFALQPAVGIAGRVTADGAPVAGARVDVHAALDDGQIGLTGVGFHLLVRPRSWVADVTGAEGQFFLNVPEAARFHVHVEKEGFARAESGPIEFDPARGNREITLTLERGGAVEGHVLVTGGVEPGGRTIALSRGDGHFESTTTDADGAYRFEGLVPGPWQIRTCEPRELEEAWRGSPRSAEAGEPIPWDLVVRAGETTRHDLDLTAELVCRLEGRFRVDGRAPVGWTWGVQGVRGLYDELFDAGGGFSFELDEPGTRVLLLVSPRAPGSYCVLRVDLELFPGTNPWEGSVETGTLELTGIEAPPIGEVDLDGQVELACTLSWEGGGSMAWTAGVFAADEGRVRLIQVPAGRIRIYEGTTVRRIGEAGPLPLLEVDLGPGETKAVALD